MLATTRATSSSASGHQPQHDDEFGRDQRDENDRVRGRASPT